MNVPFRDGQTDLLDEPLEQDIPAVVRDKFESLALQVINLGYLKYSARTIIHRIRWHQQIERGNREFKCNNNWTPELARWFHNKHPQHNGFFETRCSRFDT